MTKKPEDYGFLNLSFVLIGYSKCKLGHVCSASQGQAKNAVNVSIGRDLWFREPIGRNLNSAERMSEKVRRKPAASVERDLQVPPIKVPTNIVSSATMQCLCSTPHLLMTLSWVLILSKPEKATHVERGEAQSWLEVQAGKPQPPESSKMFKLTEMEISFLFQYVDGKRGWKLRL